MTLELAHLSVHLWNMLSPAEALSQSLTKTTTVPVSPMLTIHAEPQKTMMTLVPVACLREGPVSKQKKVVKDHDDTKTIGWSISNILNKENPDNFAPEKRAGLKCTKDTSDYLRRYNSLLMDGRLKDSVDLLESME